MDGVRLVALTLMICFAGCARHEAIETEAVVVEEADPAGRTSLTNAPYVHPRLVEELVTWVSDRGDQVVAIDLDGSEDSNRFCCDEADETFYRRVTETGPDRYDYHAFGYEVAGRTESGVYVIHTYSNDGGSASWHDVIFVVIEEDHGLVLPAKSGKAELARPRRVMKKLGQTFLGDRWKGQLKVVGNTLYIGIDRGWFSDDPVMDELPDGDDEWAQVIEIVYPPPQIPNPER